MGNKSKEGRLFDEWPETYDRWFKTPIGVLVKKAEAELLFDLLRPNRGEIILDAGCGTGVFTLDVLFLGARVTGLDISLPMLMRAGQKARGYPFRLVQGDLCRLPFKGDSFDKVVSVTALEFIEDGKGAVQELFRVTRTGGIIVVATLNSLSPWASRRKGKAKRGHPIFQKATFRSPDELRLLAPVEGVIKTAIHFNKGEDPNRAVALEEEGRRQDCETGAFVAARWEKR